MIRSNGRDISDTTRFALDLEEDGVIGREVVREVIRLMRGEDRYRPQAVSQALISYLVNNRRDRVHDPVAYLRRVVALQQERLYGKPRKKK